MNTNNKVNTKIYINNYPLNKLKEKLVNINIKTSSKEYFKTEIFSSEGIFTIEKNKVYKLKPIDKEVKLIEYVLEKSNQTNTQKIELLMDDSYFEKTFVFSHIPNDHTAITRHTFHYTLDATETKETKEKTNILELVVEGMYNENIFFPTNFYFIPNVSFDNVLVQKEFNVFLSMLN